MTEGATSGRVTTEADCIEALRAAAELLGESPTKAQYEALGLTPASATIVRVMGSWNEAKEAAGLETYPSSGSRVGPKPDGVDLPADTAWEDLTADQRWHYRNGGWNAERTLRRRARLRSRVNDIKRERGCARCGEDDPACLDFHHTDPNDKRMSICEMVTYGYGMDELESEMDGCAVLCANCHRKEHADGSESTAAEGVTEPREPVDPKAVDRRGRIRDWVSEYKRASGGCAQCDEGDPACLEFHHDGEKRESIGRMISDGHSMDEIRAELSNCTVVCANCHRKEHAERSNREP